MSYTLVENKSWHTIDVNGELISVPSDWFTVKLDKAFKCLDSKRRPLNSKERASRKGVIPYWGANSIVDFVDDHLIDEDVVLLGEDAAPFFDKSKKVAFSSHGKIWPNNHVHVLKAIDISLSYGVYVLNHLSYEKIIGVTARPKLTQSRMADIDLVMPTTYEQTAIANILSDQEDLVAQYDNLIALHEKRFAYLSDELLSGRVRLVQKEVGEVELVKNHQWQNGSNEQVPQNWKHSLLGDIVKIERGTAMNRSKCTPGMVPVIAGGKKPAYYHNVANRKGPTITISASGSAGYVAYYEEDIFASDCSTISESKNYYLPYVYLFLLHQQDEIYRAKKGGAQPHVSPKDLNVLHFMEPPIEEQTLIANVLSDQKALIAQYKKLRDAEKKRFDWLSDALLSGTYRVKVEA